MTQRLVVVRHGNTFGPGDIVRRVGRKTDIPLVDSGIAQAQALGRWLLAQSIIPSQLFTSPLQRARQTAMEMAHAMELSLSPVVLPWLTEVDYGVDEGRPESEVMARLGPQLAAWEQHSVVPDGWTVDVEALERAWVGFGVRLHLEFPGQTVAVVTSGGVARFAPALLRDVGQFKRQHALKVSTGALCEFVAEGGLWKCTRWNVRP